MGGRTGLNFLRLLQCQQPFCEPVLRLGILLFNPPMPA